MAKRKRLTPARPTSPDSPAAVSETGTMFPPEMTRHAPPIAQVAGSAAAEAALKELTDELYDARADGRLVQRLPLGAVDEAHLVRDRISHDDTEMAALKSSIQARGQQTSIEVVELDDGRFGLISGWRRLAALRALHTETGDERFATVLALLRRPESASDAYLAMVEENEIRVGLSYYERARIAARAAEQGVYPDEPSALRDLFASASRAKRSKIGSFLTIYHALDDHLRFAAAIPERLGLALVKALKEDPASADRIAGALQNHAAGTAEEEAGILSKALGKAKKQEAGSAGSVSNEPVTETIFGVQLTRARGRLVLSGDGLTDALVADLRNWLEARE